MIKSVLHTQSIHNKRKATSLDELFEAKRAFNMFALKQEFNSLLSKKKEYLLRQKRASLLVDPLPIEDNSVMIEFARFYRKLSNAPMSSDEHPAQLALIEQVIQESIIVEWPRTVSGIRDDVIEVDMAPLIHRARNVVKCRTSHPTMRIKVFAISRDDDTGLRSPPTIESFYRATLVKLSSEGGEPRQVAGRMILTQREGTAATKNSDQNGATVTHDGKLIASQASSDTHTYVILDQMDVTAKTTPFKYENGVLCATFPEMGVTLNSMVDRRQLATRYAIQVEVAINIDNKLIVKHTILSHPFLIAITNDQTEPLLHSIFWNRLGDSDNNDCSDNPVDVPLKWSVLRLALAHFIKSQITNARALADHELWHLQCMILLPRVMRCSSAAELTALEVGLYGDVLSNSSLRTSEQLRDRLLRQSVLPDTLIERRELMLDKCVAVLDMNTELNHSVWLWLFRVSEMIQDVGHRLCPSPALADKKSSKTKKQMAASEEYQTMLSLFNKGLLTLSSVLTVRALYKDLEDEPSGALMLRFCDENCGYLSIAYGYDEHSAGTPILGSISAEQVKDFKQGLPEVLMDESFPSKFDRMVKLDTVDGNFAVSLPKKSAVFHSYRTTRLQNDSIQVLDSETVRVNPLTGERVERTLPPHPSPAALFQGLMNIPQLGQGSPLPALPALNPSFLSFLHQQIALQNQVGGAGGIGGFDMGMFQRRTTNEESVDDKSDDTSMDGVTPPTGVDAILQKMLDAGKE